MAASETEQQITRARRRTLPAQTLETLEGVVQSQIPQSRREEIRKYLELFGYKPERSILQIHIAGYFGRGRPPPKELISREKAAARYQGRTFTVVGRTHDPSIIDRVIKPKKKQEEASAGYIGYLFKNKDRDEKPPDELLPLDFTPAGFAYPKDWKDLFATKGFLIALHVPADFARSKNELTRRIRQIGKGVSVKQQWDFLRELEQYGYRLKKDQASQQ
ncbi:MAG TPA: hypothetical protein VFF30_08990 [Nitrososphaerales archaeon]|nr:hypothetical protein [Nitrososphaerales archaeon]